MKWKVMAQWNSRKKKVPNPELVPNPLLESELQGTSELEYNDRVLNENYD